MQLLSPLAITAAISSALTSQPITLPGSPRNLTIQGALTYGSGGTSVDGYVQTSLDHGVTWIDIANFHFTTSSARFAYNLSAETPVTTEYTPTDGSLSANTSKDGILGPMFRVKYQSAGTYGGSTSLRVDIASIDLSANPA
jgi:hypothetical protein